MTNDMDRNRERLLEELEASRRRVAELESLLGEDPAGTSKQGMLETLLANMPDYVYFKDAQRRFVLASSLFCELFGRSLDEILGRRDEDLFPPEVAEETARDDLGVIRSGTPIICKEEGDASVGWVLTTKLPWRNADGEIIGLFGISRDITERKREEEARREADEKYRQLVENSPTVVWATDSTGTTTFVSPNVEHVYGYTPSEIMRCGEELWWGRIHPDERDLVRGAFESLFSQESTFDLQYRIQRKDGVWIWLHDKANAVTHEEDRLVAYGVFTDISAQKRAEEQRRELETQLQQAQKLESLGVLASGLAHDFNNLLVGIYGNMDLALRGLQPSSPGRNHVMEAKIAAQRAGDLIAQMLAYAGKGRTRSEDLELNGLVQEMAGLLSMSVSKKTTLRFELSKELLVTQGDPTQIRQIVMNLITNAAQALGEASGEITLSTERVECDPLLLSELRPDEELPAGTYLEVRVSDTGPGMDEETQERIFDPFFTTKPTGSGLGLSAVHGIVRAHQGALQVKSQPGAGSSFSVLLPATVQASAANGEETGPEDWRGSGTILIVDDDEVVRAVTAASVEFFGFATLTASDGIEAVEVFRRRPAEIECVLLDFKMPRMDGQETFEELRRIRADIPVILCSGYTQEDATAQLTQRGLAGFLQKPYSLERLQGRLRAVLGP